MKFWLPHSNMRLKRVETREKSLESVRMEKRDSFMLIGRAYNNRKKGKRKLTNFGLFVI